MEINYSDWAELTNKVFNASNGKDISAEAIFVHGWGDLHKEVIEFVSDLYKKSGAKFIVLNGEKEYEIGSPGLDYWTGKLVERRIPKSSVHSVLPAKHTFQEAEGFMNFAKGKSIKSGILVSVPMHISRAFLTNVGVMKKINLKIRLLPATVKNISWGKDITIRGLLNHDFEENTSRLGRFASELGRVLQYRQNYENGDKNYLIASIKEGLDYLNSLDKK